MSYALIRDGAVVDVAATIPDGSQQEPRAGRAYWLPLVEVTGDGYDADIHVLDFSIEIGASQVKLIAEVNSMHFRWLGDRPTAEVARMAARIGADAVEVAHADEDTNARLVREIKQAMPDLPVILGGHTTHENVARRLAEADGVFVGSCLKVGSRDTQVGDLMVVTTPPYLQSLLPPAFPHATLLKQVAGVGGMQAIVIDLNKGTIKWRVADGKARSTLARDLGIGGEEPERLQDALPQQRRVPPPGDLLDGEPESLEGDVRVEAPASRREPDVDVAERPDVEARVRAQVGSHHEAARVGEHVADRDRRVLGARLEPRQVADQRRVEPDEALLPQLHDEDRREDLADGAELEGGLPAHRNARIEVRQPERLAGDEALSVGDRDREPREAVRVEDVLDVGAESVHGHGGRL